MAGLMVACRSNDKKWLGRGRDPKFPVNTCNEKGTRAEGLTELTTALESPMMLQRR